jgi:hypothetical protein
MNRDELRTVTGAVPVGVINVNDITLGTAVPQNMRRYIYRVKFISQFAGPNQFTLGKRENGAAVTTIVDYLQTVVLDEMVVDPDEVKEDAAPLYTIDGPPGNVPVAAALLSLVRIVASAGVGLFTYWYIDAPA